MAGVVIGVLIGLLAACGADVASSPLAGSTASEDSPGPAPVSGEDGVAAAMSAMEVCEEVPATAEEYGSISGIWRAEESTAGDVADWQEGRHADIAGLVSGLREAALSSAVTVCVFRGEFVTPTGGPGLDGLPKPAHNVLTLLVLADGEVVLDSAGYEDLITNVTPSEWRANSG